MKTVTFTEFRQQASLLFSEVEKGESIIVIRHGKPIAEVVPFSENLSTTPSWKKPGIKLRIKGAELSKAILEEREHSI